LVYRENETNKYYNCSATAEIARVGDH